MNAPLFNFQNSAPNLMLSYFAGLPPGHPWCCVSCAAIPTGFLALLFLLLRLPVCARTCVYVCSDPALGQPLRDPENVDMMDPFLSFPANHSNSIPLYPGAGFPEAVRQAVGGGCRSGGGRLLLVTNAIEAGTWRQGGRLGALEGWGLGAPPFQCIPGGDPMPGVCSSRGCRAVEPCPVCVRTIAGSWPLSVPQGSRWMASRSAQPSSRSIVPRSRTPRRTTSTGSILRANKSMSRTWARTCTTAPSTATSSTSGTLRSSAPSHSPHLLRRF